METTEEEWVTDQAAIDTIVELKELRAGDQVRICNGGHYGLGGYEGSVVTITSDTAWIGSTEAVPSADWHYKPVVAHFETNWVICRDNIAAWRRPKKSG